MHAHLVPEPPQLTSSDFPVGAAPLLKVEYFEVGPGRIPETANDANLIVVPVQPEPLEASVLRAGEWYDLRLARGDIAILPAGVAASWRWDAPARVLLVWIEPRTIERFVERELGIAVACTSLGTVTALRNPGLHGLAVQLLRVLEMDGLGVPTLFDATARLFLTTLVRDYAVPAPSGPSDGLPPGRLQALTAFVEANLDRRIAVPELAAAAGLSVTVLARALRAGHGTTPSGLVALLRAERARAAMADGARSLTEIAAACGYADQAHMTRSFKRAFGRTPSAHRAALRAAFPTGTPPPARPRAAAAPPARASFPA